MSAGHESQGGPDIRLPETFALEQERFAAGFR
jgi:hypothetical protein